MSEKIERRTFPIELRVDQGEGETSHIRGMAAVYDSLSEDLGGFREQIQRGAFKKTLKDGADVRALFNHDPNFVLGRTRSKTLTLADELDGLAMEVEPPDTQWARDLMVSMGRGDINQMSFAFQTVKDKWEPQEDGSQIRTLLEVKLFDVSVVTYPAYPQTSAKVRSQIEQLLSSYLPDEPGQTHSPEPEPEPGQTHSISLRRRRLELLAKK